MSSLNRQLAPSFCRKPHHPHAWIPLLCILTVLSFASAGAAPDASEWSPGESLSPSPIPASSALLAYDAATGDLHAVWEEDSFGQEEIVGRRRIASNKEWTVTESLSTFSWRDEDPALLLDRAGRGHLLWTRRYALSMGADDEGTDLMWRFWNNANWSDERVLLHVDSFLPGTYGVLLAETSDAVLLFVVWPGGFRQTEFRDGAWSDLAPWDYHLGVTLAQVLVDDAGTWHVAAVGPNDNPFAPSFYDAYYTNFDGATWSQPINLSGTDGIINDLGMALDGQDRLHFLWSDPNSPFAEGDKSTIWERIYNGTVWTPNTEVAIGDEQQAINGFSLAADANHTLHLVWSEGLLVDYVHTDLDIYYRSGNGRSWGPAELVYASDGDSRMPVVAPGTQGVSLIWLEGPRTDRDVFFSQQISIPSGYHRLLLPLIVR